MSTDYSKKKNAELEELLKSRSLPHSGKKADLIARLQQYDKEHAAAEPDVPNPATSTTATVVDDEIDWDDDTAGLESTTKPSSTGAAALAAGGQGQVPNPTAVPNQAIDTDPSATSDLTIQGNTTSTADANKPSTSTTSEQPGAADPPTNTDTATIADTKAPNKQEPPQAAEFASANPLPSTSLDAELAKRKSRAARFGLQETDEQALKALERAKRFGTAGSKEEASAVKALDEALPDRTGRKRGRGRKEDEDGEDSKEGGRGNNNKRRESARRRDGGAGGAASAGGRAKRGGTKEQNKKNGTGGGGGGGEGSSLTEKDKLAAEARRKRFATAA
ncbi:hypothetical protein MMC24_002578 [Lignoscripta atroalba]|nr:hypothetical protein [Lignoscripta atroalba]